MKASLILTLGRFIEMSVDLFRGMNGTLWLVEKHPDMYIINQQHHPLQSFSAPTAAMCSSDARPGGIRRRTGNLVQALLSSTIAARKIEYAVSTVYHLLATNASDTGGGT